MTKNMFEQLINETVTDPTDYLDYSAVVEAKNFTPPTNKAKAEQLLAIVKLFYDQLALKTAQVTDQPVTIDAKYIKALEDALVLLKKNVPAGLSFGEQASKERLASVTSQVISASPETVVEIAKLGGVEDKEELAQVETLRANILKTLPSDPYFTTKVSLLFKRLQAVAEGPAE